MRPVFNESDIKKRPAKSSSAESWEREHGIEKSWMTPEQRYP
ncbi:MAG: hypothetical protein R2744_07335 [Bacteroidales bacterium]